MATSDSTGDLPRPPPGGESARAGQTAQEQAEAALRQSEADLAEAQRVAKLGSWRFDLATNAVRWSKELYRIFDIEEQAFGGTYGAFLGCIHPEDRSRVLQANAEARAGGKSFEVEYRVLTQNGQVKTIRDVGYAVKDAAGKVVGLFGTAQDITERKQAEEALRQTNARLQVILEACPLPIFSVDAEGRIESWNQAAERVFGWSATEAIGHLCPGVPPREMEDYLDMVRRAMGGEPSLGLVRYRRKNGGFPLVCNISAAPQRNAQGQAIGVTIIVEDITARQKAEAALRENEQKLKEAQQLGNIGYWERDIAADHITWSEETGRIFGLQPSTRALCQAELQKMIHPDDRRLQQQALNEALQGRRSYDVEYRVVRPDGEVRFVHVRDKASYDESGRAIRLFGTVQDITERKRTEEALRRTEDELRLVIDTIPVMAWTVRPDGVVDFLNRRWVDYSGVSLEQYVADPIGPIHPEDAARILGKWRAQMAIGEAYEDEMRLRRADGEYRWFLVRTAPLRDDQSQVVKWYGVSIDIEDRKRTGAALRESQELLQLVLATLPVGVAVTDRAGNIVVANAASKRIWGDTIVTGRERWTQTKAFWHNSGQRIAPENWASVRALSEGQTSLNELIDIETYDGQQKTILNSSAPIRNPEGVIVGAVFVNEDVTERVRAEEALHQLSGQLLRLQDEEHRRLARELHDTTAQKLAVLLLGLKRLAAQAPVLDAGAQGSLAECQALAKQCADELRTFSYLLHPPLLEELGLAGAVRDYADGFAQRSGMRVDLEVSSNLERLPREKELALFRVLQESLANVHRHSGSKTVSIRLTQLRGETRLEVQDAGRGLELKNGPGSGEKEPSKLGVGIAGMRERLHQLGGRLEIESDHRGTTVRASFPLDQPGSEHADDKNPDCG